MGNPDRFNKFAKNIRKQLADRGNKKSDSKPRSKNQSISTTKATNSKAKRKASFICKPPSPKKTKLMNDKQIGLVPIPDSTKPKVGFVNPDDSQPVDFLSSIMNTMEKDFNEKLATREREVARKKEIEKEKAAKLLEMNTAVQKHPFEIKPTVKLSFDERLACREREAIKKEKAAKLLKIKPGVKKQLLEMKPTITNVSTDRESACQKEAERRQNMSTALRQNMEKQNEMKPTISLVSREQDPARRREAERRQNMPTIGMCYKANMLKDSERSSVFIDRKDARHRQPIITLVSRERDAARRREAEKRRCMPTIDLCYQANILQDFERYLGI